jgi:preprotein translocase subunit SecG
MLLSHINEWLKRNTAIAYVFLVAIAIVGAWLVGMFEGETDPTKEITGLDLALSLFGFVIFCTAIVAGFVLFSRNRKPMTPVQGLAWERGRAKGKWSYIRAFIVRAGTTIVLTMLILILVDRSQGDRLTNLKIYAELTAGIIACIIYAAFRFWRYYESEYKSLQSKPQHNKSLNASGGSIFRN